MKVIRSILIFSLCSLLFVACAENASEKNLQQEEASSSNEIVENDFQEEADEVSDDAVKDEAEMKEKFAALGFKKIEIEIEYQGDQEFEFEIKEKKDGTIKAEVEDEMNHMKIKDSLEAFNYLYPFVKELTISQSTSKEEAIEQVLKTFQMEDNYTGFEAEFTFSDDTSIEFQDK